MTECSAFGKYITDSKLAGLEARDSNLTTQTNETRKTKILG